MLNYFTETGADFVADGGTCSYFNDRAGTQSPSTLQTERRDGPRGPRNDENLGTSAGEDREAINALGAEWCRLRRSRTPPTTVLTAMQRLDRWSMRSTPRGRGHVDVRPDSPDAATSPRGRDPDRVHLPGPRGRAGGRLGDRRCPCLRQCARDPLAQAFEPVDGGWTRRSSRSSTTSSPRARVDADQGDGQSASNPRGSRRPRRWSASPTRRRAGGHRQGVPLGRLQLLHARGPDAAAVRRRLHRHRVDSSPDEHTYLFDGVVGSLDHVLGIAAALGDVVGADVWNINSVESGRAGVQPVQLQRDGLLRRVALPGQRPRPPDRRGRPASRAGGHYYLGIGRVAGARAPLLPGRACSVLPPPRARSPEAPWRCASMGSGSAVAQVANGVVDVTLPPYVIPGRTRSPCATWAPTTRSCCIPRPPSR